MTTLLAPLDVTGIMLIILKERFKQSTQFKYEEDMLNTKIKIGPSFDWEQKEPNNRPGITIKRDDILFNNPRTGMGDIHNINNDGTVDYSTFVNTSWTIYCISKLPGEAETIAKECVEILLPFMPIIREYFKFDRFSLNRVGSITQIESYKEFWIVQLAIICSYNESWNIQETELPINDFNLYVKMFVDKKGTEAGLNI